MSNVKYFLFSVMIQITSVHLSQCVLSTTLLWWSCLALSFHLIQYMLLNPSSITCIFLKMCWNYTSNNPFYSSLACKTRWFPHLICNWVMPKHLRTTNDGYSLVSLLACTWTHGFLVGITMEGDSVVPGKEGTTK